MNHDPRDFWNERFGATEYAYGREPNDFVRAEAHRIPPGPVLCLAEGEGRNAVFLAERGHAVTAVDFSREGLRKTQSLARERGVEVTTTLADLAEYVPPVEAFSGVVAVFAHLPPLVRRRVHGWIHAALRPGGVLLLEGYHVEQLAFNTGGPRDAALLFSLPELSVELAPLRIEVGRHVRRDVVEGRFHTGPSATVQVVAARG